MLSQFQDVVVVYVGEERQRTYQLELYHLSFSYVAFTCSTLTIETLEQGVKYIQSWQ